MSTLVNPPHSSGHRVALNRSITERICLGVGYVFILLGLIGVLRPAMLGLHLSMAHNFINIISGFLALLAGYSNPRKAFAFCLLFGGIFSFLGIAGFVIGAPGYPEVVGYMEADQNLFRIIPDYLEFGTIDHLFHLLVGTFLIYSAYTFRNERRAYRKSLKKYNN
jgi:hypothetical protein